MKGSVQVGNERGDEEENPPVAFLSQPSSDPRPSAMSHGRSCCFSVRPSHAVISTNSSCCFFAPANSTFGRVKKKQKNSRQKCKLFGRRVKFKVFSFSLFRPMDGDAVIILNLKQNEGAKLYVGRAKEASGKR